MWDDDQRLRLDVGLSPITGTGSACGKNWEALSTDLSTGRTFSYPIHILETSKDTVHIWGSTLIDIPGSDRTSPQRKLLIHKLSRVIHKIPCSKAAMGDYPAPYM